MKVALVTSIKAPYRILQMENVVKNSGLDLTIYYTESGKEDRDWEVMGSNLFKEVFLKKVINFKRYGSLNKGLLPIVKHNEVVIIGGYEKPSYILLALICKIFKKPYALVHDGISCNRINENERFVKRRFKDFVIKNSKGIWGNGKVSELYFRENFNYPKEKIYNQYLTVDGTTINQLKSDRLYIRKKLRQNYGISDDAIIIQYSGRLVKIKNLESVIKAINLLDRKDIVLLITGDGVERERLEKVSKELGVKLIVAGFINNQKELFKHYFMSDIFILPSILEPWGLVVNEAMFAGLPVIVSNICGCSLDLVKEGENGYIIQPDDIDDIAYKIQDMLSNKNYIWMGDNSTKIIAKWNFDNSTHSFLTLIQEMIKNTFKLKGN
ncbi:glycosyltransferase family 4 protein [Priestia megaterium]|uniref:glycosyltransferase family 4 protein n=1 Tax=Priestia megaterium TaxID=1404 RepID=UPI002E200D2D|nr:glycosyltransferase family 4 protein [Priestia megaterium]